MPRAQAHFSAGGKRIVLATFGSLGDLHPFIALALELKARGHVPRIATQASFREKVEAEGIGFHPIRPDPSAYGDEAALMKQVMDRRRGPEFVVRIFMQFLRATYDDLTAAAQGTDVLVTHPLTYAGPLVAQQQGLVWVSTALAPMAFFSVYDPPVLAPAPAVSRLRPLGPRIFGPTFRMLKRHVRSWTKPVHDLRREVGLPPSPLDPMFEGQFSPSLTLALFSPVLAAPQPDWPPNTRVTGFPFYDRERAGLGLDPALSAFLDAGSPPIVFTLGSSAVTDAGRFYTESAKAAQRLGRRAVLLIGRDPRNRPAQPLPDGVAAFEYAPYSELLPRAVAVVHQGGIGTTGQALRAGRPMLVVPYAFDQPDNAERLSRLGVGCTISRRTYTERRAARVLAALLHDPRYAARATEVARAVRAEDGASSACNAIEDLLEGSGAEG
jgi:UDP:flavonoid glycosyltransferase YjiC (YdhE family)